jgi:predicted TIM-barrel fold metal-dependent hydrolase
MTNYFDRIHGGLPLKGIAIIDMHAHLGPYYNMHIPSSDAPAMIRLMDLCGIGKAAISATLSWEADFVLGNTMMLDAVTRFPGRIYGVCGVNGNYPELSCEELERTFANKGVVMMKIHPSGTKCKLNDSRMKAIFEFASKRKLFVLVHTWLNNDPYGNQDIFANVAADYPEIKWIMGHSGGPYGSVHAVEIAQKIQNIFLDITLSMCPAQQIEFFVKEIGSKRVLFGTDNPFIDPRPQVGRVGLAQISDEDKVNIFGANVRRHISFD